MIKACFVILHYNTMEETQKCIASIQKLENQNEIATVIVDNASPNGTGKKLAYQYEKDRRIKVLLRECNDGFSAGNNAGCKFAMKQWDPEFLIVANNDVEFCQEDFVSRVIEEYNRSGFAVLGPDIFNPETGCHQSPMTDDPPSVMRVNRTILLNQCMLALFFVTYPVLKNFFSHTWSMEHAAHPQEYQENVCLMGACLIFAREYMIERCEPFWPETKFYYEENILTLWCRQFGKKIVYQPEMQVWHREGKATETTGRLLKERVRFRMENILNAAKIYRKFLIAMKKVKN